jgi:heat shock protein HslJ
MPMAALLFALTACGGGERPGHTEAAEATLPAPGPLDERPTATTQRPPPPKPDPGPQGLLGYRWQVLLATAADGRALPMLQPNLYSQIYFEFAADGRLTIGGHCGELSGTYRVRGDVLEVSDAGQQTVGCDSRLATATSIAVNEQLSSPFRYRLDGHGVHQRLRLTGRNGTQWVLQTRDAPWGSKPVALALEVAADETDCRGVSGGSLQCLSVREWRWAMGRRVPASDWYRFHGPIEGYRHRPGAHELVRVRHYPLKLRDRLVSAYALDSATPWMPEPTEVGGSVGGPAPQ